MTFTREELDAKLQLNEARLDTKVVRIEGKIDQLTELIAGLRNDIEKQSTSLVKQMDDVKSDNKSTRITIAITVIASVLAGLAALWTTQSNLLSAVQVRSVLQSEQPQPPSAQPSQTNKSG